VPPARSPRDVAGLDADTVVTTALALVDDLGVAGFTMRRLGERLGVRAPTIYWHVGTKAALFEAIVDRVVAELADGADQAGVASGGRAWADRLRRFLDAANEILLAHPGALELMRAVHSQALERWSGVALGIMRDAGFDAAAAPTYARVALSHALGAAQAEAAIRSTPYLETVPGSAGRRVRVRPALLRAGLDPGVAAMTSFDLDEQRHVAREIFVAGVAAAARRARR
jgi:AcrR family transcriptional regulator